ncbi:MAG TPA: porin [Providencia sp.]|uniref:carbohydrate porin n=1 Tax=Providencia sp. TaxID=589 RepID=UPI000E82CE38|nr:carbohydrate porin [Providencia sp.]MBP6081211.1 carbohydrate porin [Providencia sp.]HBO24609.1 porin [Providencia sp.]
MKKFYLSAIAVALVAVLPINSQAETDLSRIEERLQALEKRAEQAEQRAATAERKAQELEHIMMTQNVVPQASQSALPAETVPKKTQKSAPGVQYNNDFGELKLYGDVEFNMDAASRKGQITSVRTALGKGNEPNKSDNWDINGRILIGLDGKHMKDNGNYAGFSVQPLADMTGKMNLDDAAFYFGQQNSWEAKLGRYEAYDMFSLGQDTFIQYSGNTANDLYGDGFGYIYMMKEGRGRSGDGGSVQLSKSLDDWYFEINALVEDGTSLFDGKTYHGYQLDNKKNVIYLRPVIAWQPNDFKVAVAMESQVINNAYGDTVEGKWQDMSKRNGYGMTVGWNTLAQDPDNGLQLTLSTAYLDATSEKDLSIGGFGLWRRAQLGYIFAHNDIKDFNSDKISSDPNSVLNSTPGKYDIHTIYASYELPQILDLDNYKIYLGAYYSRINTDTHNMINSHDNDRYGARARFKYFF